MVGLNRASIWHTDYILEKDSSGTQDERFNAAHGFPLLPLLESPLIRSFTSHSFIYPQATVV